MKKHSALALLALFGIACADSTAPARSLRTSSGMADIQGPLNPLAAGLNVGDVRICKAIGGSDPAETFTFNVTVTPLIPAGPPAAQPNVQIDALPGQTVCATAYTSTKDGEELDQVDIVEVAPPAGWTLDNIDVLQFRDGPAYVPPAPGTLDSEDETTASATVYTNNDMARIVTFSNSFETEEPPPQICDFITFGRLVTEVNGKKVVISGNAGGFNADGSIKGEFHIEANGVDNHVSDIDSYGPIAAGPLSGLVNSRIVMGVAKNGVAVELRLWDGGEPGKNTDIVYVKLNGVEILAAAGQFINQGNMQYHPNCRGPDAD